jgi:hypothetical protein
MFQKALWTLAAAAAIAAAAAVCIIALAFALYALVRPWVGQPGAAAVVAGVAALFVGIGGLLAAGKAGGGKASKVPPPAEASLAEKVIGIVRERPIIASAVGLAAGFFALRNPAFISAVVKGVLDTTKPGPPPRRR